MAKKKNPFAPPKRQDSRRRPVRPPRLRTPVIARPTGPRLYQQDDTRNSIYQLFFVPPAAFLTFTNSRSEWTFYVALWKVLKLPGDPREGRFGFTGYPGIFDYQSPAEGGRAVRGGQVIDFVVHGTSGTVGEVAIRIQTERYHLFADSMKHVNDNALKVRLAKYGRVADVYEQDYMGDPTGQAACVQAKLACFGGSVDNPLKGGRAQRLRNAA